MSLTCALAGPARLPADHTKHLYSAFATAANTPEVKQAME